MARPDRDRAQTPFAETPANRLLGMRLVASGPEGARVELPVRTDLVQEEGVVHGGFVSTLADTAAVYCVVPGLPAGAHLTGVEFKLNFMRPGIVPGGPLVAVARPLQRGRTLSVVDVEVFQDGAMLAKGLFTYMSRT